VKLTLTPAQQQRLKVLEGKPAGSLFVHEIYASIQGESTYTGLPCSFVRLTGCHLRCRWCDTPHAFHEGRLMTIPDILQEVNALAPKLVELTGGEPLVQPEAWELLAALADTGRTVLLETSGSVPIDGIDPRVVIIMDLKCPSSGELAANNYDNLDKLKPTDEVKFVIGDRADFDWAVEQVSTFKLHRMPVLFSTVFGELSDRQLCEWILKAGIDARFQPQLHKHLWAPDARGV